MNPQQRRDDEPTVTTQRADAALLPTTFLFRLTLGVLLIGLFVIALVGMSLQQSRRQYQERAEATAHNLAQALEHNIAGAVAADEIAIFAVIEEYRRQRDAGRIDAQALNAHIEKLRAHLPEIDALRIADAHGNLISGTGVSPAEQVNIADRPHFIRLRNTPSAGLTVSKPQVSRVNQKRVVVLAHRIDRPDGAFGGIAFAAIGLESLARKLANLEVGAHGAITLLDADLDLIVRHPPFPDAAAGAQMPSAELDQMVNAHPRAGNYVAAVPLDNTPRTIAYRKIADYPLYVLVGLSEDDYFAEWRKQARAMVVLAGFCLLITILAARMVYLAWKHQRASTAYAETLIDSLPGVFYRLDHEHRLVAWNKTVEKQLGPDGLKAARANVVNIIHPDDRQQFSEEIQKAFSQPYTEIEARLRLVNGLARYFHFVGIPLLLEGRTYLLGTGVDVTSHRKAERALLEKTEALQRSNADLEQFAYSVSHDMRQPLRMVSGHLQLLERALKGSLDDENRENMAFALDGAKRMDAMIVSLLEYSRVGRMTNEKAWIAIRTPLDEALRFISPAVEEAHAVVEIEGEWPQVFASHDEMTRLFQNLLGNAVKYREADRPPRVKVTSRVTGKIWQVAVSDNGIGIDPTQIERLFQFFSRLQPRTRFDGTGMGLALCRKIVEHHNGRIWVESEGEGHGSRFVFELPLNAATATTDPQMGDSHAA